MVMAMVTATATVMKRKNKGNETSRDFYQIIQVLE